MLGAHTSHDLGDERRSRQVGSIPTKVFFRKMLARSSESRLPESARRFVTSWVALGKAGPLHRIDDDASPREFLSPTSAETQRAYLWLAAKGSTCHTHYDTSHNFYYLLNGTQTIKLWYPSRWKQLNVFPYLHARTQQSQWYNHSNSRVTQKESTERLQMPKEDASFTLQAGELLYIPPYYFYQVGVQASRRCTCTNYQSCLGPAEKESHQPDCCSFSLLDRKSIIDNCHQYLERLI